MSMKARLVPTGATVLAMVVASPRAVFSQAPLNPASWTLQVPAKPVAVAGALTATLSARIERGWHMYSITQPPGGPITTRVSVPDGQPFALSGEVKGPKPVKKRDDVFAMDVEYYDEGADFSVPVKVAPGTSPGKQKLTVQVRYQMCNDRLCLPPKTVKAEAEVEVSPAAR
jgi:DsbC/DsbD-like thiol-disulfide interchange protein